MENNIIIQNIKYLINYYGISQNKFAEKIGISGSNLASIMTGNRKIGNTFINKIILALEINKLWLVTGKGDIFKNPPQNLFQTHDNNYTGHQHFLVLENQILLETIKNQQETIKILQDNMKIMQTIIDGFINRKIIE